MSRSMLGIHHVTAIAGDAQRNLDFYAGVLGLRFVKRTVNFDDPLTYHLYYGDEDGAPGTILTFFPWAGVPRGRRGAGQVVSTAFAVPPGSLDMWETRLRAASPAGSAAPFFSRTVRFGEAVLQFEDPDGLGLELIETASPGPGRAPVRAGLPPDIAIRGVHSVTILARDAQPTAAFVADALGWSRLGSETAPDGSGERTRFVAATDDARGAPSRFVDLLADPAALPGRLGSGIVHHVAWRTPDDAGQAAWREDLARRGRGVSPVMDRKYFRSIYFREPGGVLFEIATDPPGFAVDEPAASLGDRLQLPEEVESHRATLEERLPRLVVPVASAS